MVKRVIKNWKPIFKIAEVSGVFLGGIMLVLIFRGGFDVMETWMLRMLIDAAKENQAIIGMCIFLFCLILAEGIMGIISGMWIGRTVIKGRKNIQMHLMNKLLDWPHSTLSDMGTGEILTRLQTDSRQCVESIRYFLQTVVYGGILFIWPIIICFFISWQLTLLSILMVPLIFICAKKFSVKIGAASEELQNKEGKANKIFQECVWQIPTTKAYSAQQEWTGYLNQTFCELYRAKNKKVFSQLVYEPFLNIIQILPQIVIIAVGGCLLIQHKVTVGDLLLFTIFLGYITNGMMGIPQWLAQYRQFSGHRKRIFEILQIPFFSGKDVEKEEKPDIILNSMEFMYANRKFGISDISVEIEKGMHVAIVGESGCGKTTLLKTIAGLNRPQKGEAFVLGYDLFQCRPEQLYCHLALVLQDTYLFPGTIRENLIAGNRNISLEQLENACKKAKIWEWICKLPKGLDTTLSEFSSNISGGQKQRIGIARAILRKADVWLIDEPTSSLDYQTAQDILNNLRDITRTYTTVTVTHDMSNMSEYDFILVMEDGKLVQTGTHFELLKKEGVYAKLYEKERNE